MAARQGGLTAGSPDASQALSDALGALGAAFDRAVATRGVVEHRRLVAGRGVRLRFAGDTLVEPILGAIDHLPVNRGTDELTVCIWDTASTGTRLPQNPLIPRRSEVTHGPLFRNRDLSFLLQHGDRALSFLDAPAGTAFHCLPDASPSVHHRGAPLRALLSWWLQGLGSQLVHAGAVGIPGAAVLLTGPSGSGKSTTALACARDGLLYLGDDYVVVEPDPPVVHSLYRSAKLDRAHRECHRALLPSTVESDSHEKALGFLGRSDSLVLPIRAIVLPRVVREPRSSTRRTTRGSALLALAPSTLLQVPGEAEASLRAMRDLTAAVPAYELRLGADLDHVPDIVRALLEDE